MDKQYYVITHIINITILTTENFLPQIQAVGCHQSGDIWVVTCSKAEQVYLASIAQHWLPKLLDQLSITQKTFPVVVHGISSTFNHVIAVMSSLSLTKTSTLSPIHQCSSRPNSSHTHRTTNRLENMHL